MKYAMKKGETLEQMSARFKVPVCALVRYNGAEIFGKSGLVLEIPGECGAKKEAEYTARAGDTLRSIAKKFGTTMRAVAEANKISAVREGDTLKIPLPREGTFVYVARMGDSAASVAEKFKMTENELTELNDLNGGSLYAGMELIVKK